MNAHREKSNYCHKCEKRRAAERDPIKNAFYNLRTNAKRRGKDFNLTFEDFAAFVLQNPDYMKKRGRKLKKLQIDRINPAGGYSLDNIQSITMAENLAKRKYKFQKEDPTAENFCPF